MRKRVGLRGALHAIAVGVALTSGGGAIAQQSTQSEVSESDLDELCQAILTTKTRQEFRASVIAMTALADEGDACHSIAVAHWARLQEGAQSSPAPGSSLSAPVIAGQVGYAFL